MSQADWDAAVPFYKINEKDVIVDLGGFGREAELLAYTEGSFVGYLRPWARHNVMFTVHRSGLSFPDMFSGTDTRDSAFDVIKITNLDCDNRNHEGLSVLSDHFARWRARVGPLIVDHAVGPERINSRYVACPDQYIEDKEEHDVDPPEGGGGPVEDEPDPQGPTTCIVRYTYWRDTGAIISQQILRCF